MGSKARRFYRIENTDRFGPYRVLIIPDWRHRTHENPRTHPSPWVDQKLGSMTSDQVCGFVSLKGLMEWFNKAELKRLRKLGFRCAVYSSTHYKIGEHQSILCPDQFIGHIPITRLVRLPYGNLTESTREEDISALVEEA